MQIQSAPQGNVKNLKTEREKPGAFDEVSPYKLNNRYFQQQLMLTIAQRLQVTLEVEWVVEQFMGLIQEAFEFDGFHYQHASPEISIDQGRQKGHSCSYRLSVEGDELGRLNVYRGRKFRESELVLLENFLGSLVYPLRNAINYRRAILSSLFDSLTGVYNRSSFDQALSREMNLATRNNQAFSVLVVDIDHFKHVNDTHGHAAGDQVIRSVANSISSHIRNTDQVFRYGGEEFVVLLNNTDCQGASLIASRILDSVREASTQIQDKSIDVTVSIGVTCRSESDSIETLFERADGALYSAKHRGRDRVVIAA